MKYLSRKEAAERIGITPETLAVYGSKNHPMLSKLPFTREGKKIEYLESDVDSFIQSRRIRVGGKTCSE